MREHGDAKFAILPQAFGAEDKYATSLVRANLKSTGGYVLLSILLISGVLPAVTLAPAASAQVQYISASRGVVNLGMTTSITVTAPAAGNYNLVVLLPDKARHPSR